MSKEDREKLRRTWRRDGRKPRPSAARSSIRVFYADYQACRWRACCRIKIQRSIDGKPNEEMIFDTFKVNPKIDAKKFQVSK